MNKVLIDSSVWINYFKNNPAVLILDELIDQDRICINKVILTELIPFLNEKKEFELIDILESIEDIPLNINWEKIIECQNINLKNNIRKVGIQDLIILQNVLDNDLEIFSLDNHFKLMNKVHKIKLFKK